MAKVDDWFLDWLPRHIERLPRADWPPLDSEFWNAWKSAFRKHGLTYAVADAASIELAEAPPAHIDRHLEGMLNKAKVVWEKAAAAESGGGDRETALTLSRDCDDCGWQGLATRYRRYSKGQSDDQGRTYPDYIVLYCRCQYGRWMERTHRTGNEESRQTRKRIPDLADHPFLWGEEYRLPQPDFAPAEERPAF